MYQRTYSWTERECRQLWDDILRSGSDDGIDAHFVGSIVYIEESQFHVMNRPPLLVIDGQQRLTTVMLILEALARHVGDAEPVDGFSAAKLREYYLRNRLESGDRRFKLLLTQTDRTSLIALVLCPQTFVGLVSAWRGVVCGLVGGMSERVRVRRLTHEEGQALQRIV
ncbi:MAG: DUF262 domain-containing protein, partial [Acidimicrobiaceae bacterium]|nr:DUF262 domain-containing protein [Acidimicrobiaceae bacterium]